MFNAFRYFEEFRESLGEEVALKLARALAEIYENLSRSVTKEEFNELREIVREQGENLKVLTQRVDQLTQRVDQLTEDVRRLTGEMGKMKTDLSDLRRQVGGLSHTVGYTLENEAYRYLPGLLERDYGVRVEGDLLRTFVEDERGRPVEVNIFGRARRDGHTLIILGEAKAQLSRNDVDRFLRRKVKPLEGIFPEKFLVLVTHMITHPSVEEYARSRGIALYYSYQFR